MKRPFPFKGIAIAGVTASGKSALAIGLAKRTSGTIINADSAQIYADLRVLSARPSIEDEAKAAHALYGVIDGAMPFSAMDWALRAADEINGCNFPIVVGGTGLYFRSLFEGLSAIPDIPAEIRAKWRREATERGAEALHRVLSQRDAVMAARLQPNDQQRVTRALEVHDATGRSLHEWQAQTGTPLIDPQGWLRVVVKTDRSEILERIEKRFDVMLDQGAVEEVECLCARRLNPAMPVMKAIGVPEIASFLQGACTLAEVKDQAVLATRQYAKRQGTWFRGQMKDWQLASAADLLEQFTA